MFKVLKRPNFWIVFLGDTVLVGLAYFLAYYLRFDGNISAASLAQWKNTVVWIIPLKLASLYFFGLYKGMWRYTSIHDFINLFFSRLTIAGLDLAKLTLSPKSFLISKS